MGWRYWWCCWCCCWRWCWPDGAIGRGRYGRSPAGGPKPLYRPTAPTTRPRAGRAGGFRVAAADESLAGLLDRADVVVIDTETTGVGARSEVLDVAIIDTTGRVLLDAVSLPQGAIRREVSNMHGLTRDRLRKMGRATLAGSASGGLRRAARSDLGRGVECRV